MNAPTVNRPFLAKVGRVIAVALVVLALMPLMENSAVAVVDQGTPSISVTAEPMPSARDDCLAGRRRTGTSALLLGVDPAPSCATLLAVADDVARHRSPGVQP